MKQTFAVGAVLYETIFGVFIVHEKEQKRILEAKERQERELRRDRDQALEFLEQVRPDIAFSRVRLQWGLNPHSNLYPALTRLEEAKLLTQGYVNILLLIAPDSLRQDHAALTLIALRDEKLLTLRVNRLLDSKICLSALNILREAGLLNNRNLEFIYNQGRDIRETQNKKASILACLSHHGVILNPKQRFELQRKWSDKQIQNFINITSNLQKVNAISPMIVRQLFVLSTLLSILAQYMTKEQINFSRNEPEFKWTVDKVALILQQPQDAEDIIFVLHTLNIRKMDRHLPKVLANLQNIQFIRRILQKTSHFLFDEFYDAVFKYPECAEQMREVLLKLKFAKGGLIIIPSTTLSSLISEKNLKLIYNYRQHIEVINQALQLLDDEWLLDQKNFDIIMRQPAKAYKFAQVIIHYRDTFNIMEIEYDLPKLLKTDHPDKYVAAREILYKHDLMQYLSLIWENPAFDAHADKIAEGFVYLHQKKLSVVAHCSFLASAISYGADYVSTVNAFKMITPENNELLQPWFSKIAKTGVNVPKVIQALLRLKQLGLFAPETCEAVLRCPGRADELVTAFQKLYAAGLDCSESINAVTDSKGSPVAAAEFLMTSQLPNKQCDPMAVTVVKAVPSDFTPVAQLFNLLNELKIATPANQKALIALHAQAENILTAFNTALEQTAENPQQNPQHLLDDCVKSALSQIAGPQRKKLEQVLTTLYSTGRLTRKNYTAMIEYKPEPGSKNSTARNLWEESLKLEELFFLIELDFARIRTRPSAQQYAAISSHIQDIENLQSLYIHLRHNFEQKPANLDAVLENITYLDVLLEVMIPEIHSWQTQLYLDATLKLIRAGYGEHLREAVFQLSNAGSFNPAALDMLINNHQDPHLMLERVEQALKSSPRPESQLPSKTGVFSGFRDVGNLVQSGLKKLPYELTALTSGFLTKNGDALFFSKIPKEEKEEKDHKGNNQGLINQFR